MGRDLSIDNAVAAPEVACLHSAGRTEAPPLATTSRGIGHVIENLFSEDGRRIVICAGHHFGGVRCPSDSETDNHVHVDLGIRRTVPHTTAEVAERFAGAPLRALIYNTGISP
ncbi:MULTISPECIES: hypothetical protein [unclassified Bradyrhizobium]|uniref:hypothetical protein n=1 Tax=unclassified Bradyrhizobium TaxID=2631580 RepID=UPI00339A84D9